MADGWSLYQEEIDILRAFDIPMIYHSPRIFHAQKSPARHGSAPVVVVRDLAEARQLAQVIRGEASRDFFLTTFAPCPGCAGGQ